MSENTPATSDGDDGADGDRDVGAAHRGAVTSGTAPAVGRGRAAASAQDTEAARRAARATDRRGALFGLLTAGAAVVAGTAVGGGGERDAGTEPVPATGRTVEASVGVEGMRFVPDTVDVAPGDRLVVSLDNTSDQVHDLVLELSSGATATTGRVAAGAVGTLDAGVVSGPLEGWCSIAGHRAQGMVFHVTAGGRSAASGGQDASPAGQGAASSDDAVPDYSAVLPEDVAAFDAVLAPAGSGALHEHTFTVMEQVMHVGGGVTQTRMTFNGQVPGPVLRGRVGDTFRITLVNEGSMSHSIDFHAGVVPPDDVMRSINPGENLVYEFVAQRAGIWLYHCSTAPMSVHLAGGMHGAVVIDPPGLEGVDREYLVVQSEIYLGPEGGETDAAKVAAKTPDLFAFNGTAFQYRDRPLPAGPGERVRFWVLNAGPSEPMSFHCVGLQFDQVFFEGAWTLGGPDRIGAAWSGGSQALGLEPAQGGFVEAVPPGAGTYTFVTHAFADMEKGAMGRLVVA
ncbi:multicopper oxidase domain-containing protein [Actinomyces sp. oral taxon 448]|uniref:multicopper oxidase domain-containing protein n=1 Tax=Actinomyces sp. oral taxon 448 TaxID=712124 RepID=UPI000218A303|nr:multicopper oxidase domain-containing protein [Actinomyces sp. oral taxon 448]EGQ73134.1 multicopper oxidase domain protein [Actinomyces sp. oral taxon 448 str. F0400]